MLQTVDPKWRHYAMESIYFKRNFNLQWAKEKSFPHLDSPLLLEMSSLRLSLALPSCRNHPDWNNKCSHTKGYNLDSIHCATRENTFYRCAKYQNLDTTSNACKFSLQIEMSWFFLYGGDDHLALWFWMFVSHYGWRRCRWKHFRSYTCRYTHVQQTFNLWGYYVIVGLKFINY